MSLNRARWINGSLVVVALSSTALVICTRHSVTTSERLARENNVFYGWRPHELRQIRITPLDAAEGSPLYLTRKAQSTDPHDFALDEEDPRQADPGAVSELLGLLEYATWLRRIDPATADRHAFGLERPWLEVRVTFESGSYRLVVGGPAPSPAGARYAELTGAGDRSLGLLAADLVERLQVDRRAFLGSQLLPYAKSETTRVELEGVGGQRTLVRDALGFRLDGPLGPRADGIAVDRMFFQMARVAADPYVELDEARRSQQEIETVQVTQSHETRAPVRVVLGGACPERPDRILALRESDPPLAGCVPATVLPALQATRQDLVDTTPFSFRADEVDHVMVAEGGKVIEAVRSGSRFDLLRPRRRELELDAGNEFLEALVSPSGNLEPPDSPSTPKALGLDPPRGTVTLRGLLEAKDEPVELTVHYSSPDPEGRVWLQRTDDNALLALNARRATAFSADDTWTRSRSLLKLEQNAIQRVEIQDGGSSRTIERTAEGGLRLVEPQGFDIDAGLASDWISTLSQLDVVRWLAPADAAAKRSDRPLRVNVTYEEHGDSRTLAFTAGERTAGGYVAELTSPGDERPPFVLSTSAYRTLSTLPISRLIMVPDVDHLEHVVLEAHGVRIALERRSGDLVSADGTLDSETVSLIEQGLAALRPEAVIGLGPPLRDHGFEAPELIIEGRVRHPGKTPQTFTYRFGRVGRWQGRAVQHGRADGVNATFVFDHEDIKRLLDWL